MRTGYKMAFALLAGVGIGGAAGSVLHAQPPPPAYVILEKSAISDPAGLRNYASKEDALIEKHGGKFVIQGGKPIALDEGTPPLRFTMIEFDSLAQVQAWQNESAQGELRAIRASASQGTSFAVVSKPK